MKKKGKGILITYFLSAAIILSAAYLFQNVVRALLWKQSVSSVMETTSQGALTLQVQIKNAYETLYKLQNVLEKSNDDETDKILREYRRFSPDINIYFEGEDDKLRELKDKGIINPHISSVSEENVFAVYVRHVFDDGRNAFLIKEINVSEVKTTYALSFYGNKGYSYIVDSEGNVLISPEDNRDDGITQNIFATQSDEDIRYSTELKSNFENGKSGWMNDDFGRKNMFMGYKPIGYESNWYLVTMIPAKVINREASYIIYMTFIMVAVVVAAVVCIYIATIRNRRITEENINNQAGYIEWIFNVIPEGIALIETQYPYKNIRINKQGLNVLGYNAGEDDCLINGGTFTDIVYKEDTGYFVSKMQEAVQEGIRTEFECRVDGEDDSFRWISGFAEKNPDCDGREIIILTYRDITGVKEEEIKTEAHRKSERQILMTVVAQAYPVIAAIDFDTDYVQFVYANIPLSDEIIHSASYSELYSVLYQKIDEGHREEFAESFGKDKIMANRSNVWMDVELPMEDNETHWFSMNIIFVEDDENNEKRAVFMGRICDEQKAMEEHRAQVLRNAIETAHLASEAKGRFLADMSHDIRTPMNAIMGMTEIVLERLSDPEYVKYGLLKIADSSRHLLSLVNDILDMSKIESGKITLRSENFDYRELIYEVVGLVKLQAAKLGHSINVSINIPENTYVYGDMLRIRQIYLNILSNAVKYTKENGIIFIQCDICGEADDKQLFRFVCSDNGIGMTEEFVRHIFDPFEREEACTQDRQQGTGLGMPIVKNLTEIMDGSIDIKSKPGVGTTITVILPLSPGMHSADESGSNVKKIYKEPEIVKFDTESFENKRALIAEDNEMNREILSIFLSGMGVESECAVNGKMAVEMMEGSDNMYYDIIFMDVRMPVMDGYEAAVCIRQLNRSDNTIPIVATTANAFSDDEKLAYKAGMDAYLTKPVDRKKLYDILKKFIG